MQGYSGARSADPFRSLSYRLEPDFSQPLAGASTEIRARVKRRLGAIYGEDGTDSLVRQVERLIRVHDAHSTPEIRQAERDFDPRMRFTERDVVLITYGDLVVSRNRPPLRTLSDFAFVLFRGLVTIVHVLPFFPSSSDRGFSIISYEEVDPKLGSWDEITELGRRFRLMFDGVFNHISSRSRRFQRFLTGDPDYEDFFRVFSTRTAIHPDHLRLILRPRTSDLLSDYHTVDGVKWVWTTFSRDQIDLNFHNPKVLLAILEILLYYVRRGADLVRLDAVTYIWHELGTSCAHLEEGHEVVKLFRDVLDAAAPHVGIVTETNVPHADNITYFGNGSDEAQMVYNFALPPLVLHSFVTGSARTLSRWASTVSPPSDTTAFFNFLDSHDGIGLMGARGILSSAEIDELCSHVKARGGLISMKSAGDGTPTPYELNITWWSALNGEDSGEPLEIQIDRFIASRAVALVLSGVPGIYLPSFFGSKNDLEAVRRDGQARSINRPALEEEWLFSQFSDPASLPSKIVSRLTHLLEKRSCEPAFDPNASQEILDAAPGVLAVRRTSRDGGCRVLSLINVSRETVSIEIPNLEGDRPVTDILSGRVWWPEGNRIPLALDPYQVLWLR